MPSGPVLVIAALIGIGYYTVEAVKAPIHKAGHAICHVVTFGQKCAPKTTTKTTSWLPPLPLADEPCPPGYAFMAGESLHGCFDARIVQK